MKPKSLTVTPSPIPPFQRWSTPYSQSATQIIAATTSTEDKDTAPVLDMRLFLPLTATESPKKNSTSDKFNSFNTTQSNSFLGPN